MEGAKEQLERQPCEVYSRIVGYIRPVDQWNPGKQSEFIDRKTFDVCACSGEDGAGV
ncbi:MAG: anaerobic ribonucleoside triphosphate reductase [Parcubacteria group bacterium ADurb.Bin326]|nr:MAG: anaerobic ribonucleoside triphosphate reductase [Parcubacteria group bacterium ADurb.Bin326]